MHSDQLFCDQQTIEDLEVRIMVHSFISLTFLRTLLFVSKTEKELNGLKLHSYIEINNSVIGLLNRLFRNGFSEMWDK